MEQKYETDEVILAIAASQAKLIETYGVSEINDELLGQELTLSVNVGMGATNPDQKLGRFMGAMQAYSSVATMELPGLDMKEIGREVDAFRRDRVVHHQAGEFVGTETALFRFDYFWSEALRPDGFFFACDGIRLDYGADIPSEASVTLGSLLLQVVDGGA